jgi:hypothetical protein
MAEETHLAELRKGRESWNAWREANPLIHPDLSMVSLSGVDRTVKKSQQKRLMKSYRTDLRGFNFSSTNFHRTFCESLDFSDCNCESASFYEADLTSARFCGATLVNTSFRKAMLSSANFASATIRNANFNRAMMAGANLTGATIDNCIVFGVSAWELQIDEKTTQSRLIIENINFPVTSIGATSSTDLDFYPFMVDDIQVAQFIFLLKNYKNFRQTINAVIDKCVLILGRFRDGGMDILQAVSKRLQDGRYMPIIFDFDRPDQLDLMDTVRVLGGLSNFIVADLSGPSVSGELFDILKNFKKPVIPFLKKGEPLIGNYHSLINEYTADPIFYNTLPELLEGLGAEIDLIDKKNTDIREKLQKQDEDRKKWKRLGNIP